jgi:hypothetical protein
MNTLIDLATAALTALTVLGLIYITVAVVLGAAARRVARYEGVPGDVLAVLTVILWPVLLVVPLRWLDRIASRGAP